MRPRGVVASTMSSCSFQSGSEIWVRMMPGATALTRTFGESSSARHRVKMDEGCLGGRVEVQVPPHRHGGARGVVDDHATALPHRRVPRQSSPQEGSPHVHPERRVEHGVVDLGQRPVGVAVARIVHEDVDPAEAIDRGVDAAPRSFLIRGIDGDADDLRADGFCGGVRRVLVARRDDDVRAPARTSAAAVASPMPRDPPVTMAVVPLRSAAV